MTHIWQNHRVRVTALLICAALAAGCSGEADFSGAIETETLSAEDYRPEITSIDRLMFRARPLESADRTALESLLEGMAGRVRSTSRSKFLLVESLELRRLAHHAASLPPGSSGAPLQNDWMRIRNNLFDDRAWFARSAADLEPALTESARVTAMAPPVPAPEDGTPGAMNVVRGNDLAPAPTTLAGRWRAVTVTANGTPREDDELSGSRWLFDLPRLTITDRSARSTAFNCHVAGEYLSVMTPSGQEGWMKYEFAGGALRVAFFDNLEGGKPKSFEGEGGRPLLVVVRLERETQQESTGRP